MDTQIQRPGFLTSILPIFLFLFLAILVGAGGYYIGVREGVKTQQVSQVQPEGKTEAPTVTQEELPISLSLLKNPIIHQWRGLVKGTLVAKDEDSITIKDEQGNSLNIPLRVPPAEKDNALFFDGTTEISLSDIPIGTKLAGDFFTVPGFEDRIVGGSFSIVK